MKPIALMALLVGLTSSAFPSPAHAQAIQCILTHSASADVNPNRQLSVGTTTNDKIQSTIVGLGSKTAYVTIDGDPSRYTLTLRKTSADAFYYEQDTFFPDAGLIHWVYFKRSRTVTYAKLRAFPLTGDPSSYLMLGLCK